MKKLALLLIFSIVLCGCAAPRSSSKAIYVVAKQDKYSNTSASRNAFSAGETPCIKISGYDSSTFSYRLYKEGMLESVDTGIVNKKGDNEVLTCWNNLPFGHYTFKIYDSSGNYVDTIKFSMGK